MILVTIQRFYDDPGQFLTWVTIQHGIMTRVRIQRGIITQGHNSTWYLDNGYNKSTRKSDHVIIQLEKMILITIERVS